MGRRSSSVNNVLLGIASVIIGNILLLMVLYVITLVATTILPTVSWLPFIFIFALIGIGLVQLLYVIPLCLWLKRKERFDTIQGVIVGAVLTALLNGGCFLVIWATIN